MKIGDIMWNGRYPLMRYQITAEINREKNTQWELLCTNCEHSGSACRILITRDDNKNFAYVGMVNENCDEDISERYYYFHKDNGFFYLTKEEAEIAKLRKYIDLARNEIKEHQQGIEYQRKSIVDYENMLEFYEKLLKK